MPTLHIPQRPGRGLGVYWVVAESVAKATPGFESGLPNGVLKTAGVRSI